MYEGAVQDLIDELGRLPGVGPKGAQRIAFHLLQADPQDVERLSDVLLAVKEKVRYCERCFNVAESQFCRVCADQRRDQSAICVVEEPKDVVAIERTREFRGTYHVLGGAISPIDGIGPDQLHLPELIERLKKDTVEEIILAMNSSVEGESTALYLQKFIDEADISVKITRLARGIPVGVDLEYADQITLSHALEGRQTLS